MTNARKRDETISISGKMARFKILVDGKQSSFRSTLFSMHILVHFVGDNSWKHQSKRFKIIQSTVFVFFFW